MNYPLLNQEEKSYPVDTIHLTQLYHILCTQDEISVASISCFNEIVHKAALCESELYQWGSFTSAGPRYSIPKQRHYSISVDTNPYRFWCR